MKQLPVPFIGQGHSLPTGCESVSAAMALQYLGFSVTAEDFARRHLPSARFTGIPAASGMAGPRRAFVRALTTRTPWAAGTGDKKRDVPLFGRFGPGQSRDLPGQKRDRSGAWLSVPPVYRPGDSGADLDQH